MTLLFPQLCFLFIPKPHVYLHEGNHTVLRNVHEQGFNQYESYYIIVFVDCKLKRNRKAQKNMLDFLFRAGMNKIAIELFSGFHQSAGSALLHALSENAGDR